MNYWVGDNRIYMCLYFLINLIYFFLNLFVVYFKNVFYTIGSDIL